MHAPFPIAFILDAACKLPNFNCSLFERSESQSESVEVYTYLGISYLASRIQLAPHARRRAVPKTVSGWIPVRLTSDEVAKSGRTGIMTAYTENMLSRKRTLRTA